MLNIVKENYFNWATNMLFFGAILFYCGIYIFSDGGDNARAFYIFVMLPMLIILFGLNKEFLSNHAIWLLMLLPIYLTLSHFWALEENIIRSTMFHLKKVVFIWFFIIAMIYIFEKKPHFLRRLLQSMLIVGAVSALISILCFLSGECGVVDGRLASFSVQDINKAGAMYTITMCLSIFFFFYGFHRSEKNGYLMQCFLIVCFAVCFAATYFAKTHATWIMMAVMVFLFLIPKWTVKSTLSILFVSLVAVSIFFYFDGYAYLIKDGSFNIRVRLIQESLLVAENNMLFGIGMTHKLPLLGLPHPHNILIDVYRFGGLIGLFLLLIPISYFIIKGMALAGDNVLIRFCLAWFIGSVAIMSVYGQQPITRPGGYIWFLYWMPLLALVAEVMRKRKGKLDG